MTSSTSTLASTARLGGRFKPWAPASVAGGPIAKAPIANPQITAMAAAVILDERILRLRFRCGHGDMIGGAAEGGDRGQETEDRRAASTFIRPPSSVVRSPPQTSGSLAAISMPKPARPT